MARGTHREGSESRAALACCFRCARRSEDGSAAAPLNRPPLGWEAPPLRATTGGPRRRASHRPTTLPSTTSTAPTGMPPSNIPLRACANTREPRMADQRIGPSGALRLRPRGRLAAPTSLMASSRYLQRARVSGLGKAEELAAPRGRRRLRREPSRSRRPGHALLVVGRRLGNRLCVSHGCGRAQRRERNGIRARARRRGLLYISRW